MKDEPGRKQSHSQDQQREERLRECVEQKEDGSGDGRRD
jgi:hypothetical protein